MSARSPNVIVTGATGWLGTNLIKALVEGLPGVANLDSPRADLKLRCLVLPGEDVTSIQKLCPTAEILRGDLSSPEAASAICRDAEAATLFHTAGIIHPRRIKEFYDVNLHGTRNLLQAASVARVRRCVVVSSNSPCGVNPHPDHLFDESSPYHPYMNYGRSKMLMEQEVAKLSAEKKLETVVIRAPWFYGPFQPPRQTLFFTMIRDGKAPIVGGGRNRRSMAFTDNLCQGLLLAAASPRAAGKLYWIADERPYTMCEVIDGVERLLEQEFNVPCRHKRLRLPGSASEAAWVVDKFLQSLGFYHQKVHVLSEMNKTIACSVRTAQDELGYRPTVSLEEGMRRSLTWLRGTPHWPF